MPNDVALFAPRPVRVNSLPTNNRSSSRASRLISTPVDAFARIKLAEDDQITSDDLSPHPGGRLTSPRQTLPADALEEFLSILRPGLISSGSNAFRSRRHGAAVLPIFPYERPHPYKRERTHSKGSSVSSVDSEDSDCKRKESTPSPQTALLYPNAEQTTEPDESVVTVTGEDWRIAGSLESPISRSHTRNPFQRHPSYETAVSRFSISHLPALLPLPPSPPLAPDASSTQELSLPLTPDAMEIEISDHGPRF